MCQEPSIPESLLREGQAMVEALATDLAGAGLQIDRMVDKTIRRCDDVPLAQITEHLLQSAEEEKPLFDHLVDEADLTILIAPETDGALAERARWTREAGGRLLGPSEEVIALATDKHGLALQLQAAGIPVPEGIALSPGSRLPDDFDYPAVLKPRDGAGSLQMRLLQTVDPSVTIPFAARLESYRSGQPTSVVVFCGPAGLTTLPACSQKLSADGHFTYLGGSLPLPTELAQRAEQLARRAVAACGEPRGYLGVDLILGDQSEADCVIEINPRLTTSYLLLREAARENLAGKMVAWSLGDCSPPQFDLRPLEFSLKREMMT